MTSEFPTFKKKIVRNGIAAIEVFDLPPTTSHMEQYPKQFIHTQTDFGVIVSGHSMEPRYPDKAVVFVKSTQVVAPGEIGIFVLDGQTYIKQLQVDSETGDVSLHSLNPECSDVKVSPYADFRPQGKVLGGYDPATKKMIWK